MFPNPTTDKFFIQMSESVKDLRVSIYSLEGKFIREIKASNDKLIEVSAEGLQTGTYLIQCKSKEKTIETTTPSIVTRTEILLKGLMRPISRLVAREMFSLNSVKI